MGGGTDPDKRCWPRWMKDACTILEACPVREGESNWGAALSAWMRLEEAYTFETSVSQRIKPGLRPSEVGQWIKNGRPVTRETVVAKHEVLVGKWWDWYSSLSPSWRKKDEAGRPVIDEGAAAGDWGVLVHPGANGMLTVLLPLAWWRQGEEGAPSEDWLAAVRDVAWVLEGLLSAAKTRWVPYSHAVWGTNCRSGSPFRKRKSGTDEGRGKARKKARR
ncbi:hypothetical protein C8R47DRAFT_982738 [Mycena vitilis]|nr:hypothetical protein C8R47DRAFT_982738 [Mycena vitilis]